MQLRLVSLRFRPMTPERVASVRAALIDEPARFGRLPRAYRDVDELAEVACHLDGMQLRNATPRAQNLPAVKAAAFEENPAALGITLRPADVREHPLAWVPRFLRNTRARVRHMKEAMAEHRADHGPLLSKAKLRAPLLRQLKAHPAAYARLPARLQANLHVLSVAYGARPEGVSASARADGKLAALHAEGKADWRAYFRHPELIPLLHERYPELAPIVELQRQLKQLNIDHAERLPRDLTLVQELIHNRLTSPKDDPKPLMVAIFPKRDPNGGFAHPRLEQFLQTHRVVYFESGSGAETLDILKRATAEKKAARAWIAGHGKPTEIRFGEGEDGALTVNDEAAMKAAGIDQCFEPGALIILQACSTGKGRELATNVVNLFGRTVPDAHTVGPTRPSFEAVQEQRSDGSIEEWSFGLPRPSLTHHQGRHEASVVAWA